MIELMGKRKLFINVAEHLLLSDSITLLPKDKVTLELLEHIEVTEEILTRIRELKAMGYEFALDDYVFHSDPCPLFELVDIIKVDILNADLNALDQLVAYLRQWPCKLLAEKVETDKAALQDWCPCKICISGSVCVHRCGYRATEGLDEYCQASRLSPKLGELER